MKRRKIKPKTKELVTFTFLVILVLYISMGHMLKFPVPNILNINKSPNMDILVSIGALSSLTYGLVPRRKNLPASENLIRLLTKREDLISINKAVDIYNILSIESKLCLGAHDIDKVDGNVTLKITDGTEKFLPLESEELNLVKSGEYSFLDDNNDVVCWLDIRQVDKTKVTEDSKNVLYLIIGNKKTTDEELEKVTNNLISLTTKFASSATIVK